MTEEVGPGWEPVFSVTPGTAGISSAGPPSQEALGARRPKAES